MERFASTIANPSWAGFKFQPLKEGDCLAVFSPNDVLYPTVLWGTLRAGGRATTANHVYTVEELVHQLTDANAKLLVTHPLVLETALKAAKEAGIPENNIILFESDGKSSFPTVDDLLKAGEKMPPVPKVVFKPGDSAKTIAFLCFSSGTSGKSKGVMISHRNVIANVCQFRGFDESLTPGADKLIGQLPFYHIYGLILLVHIATYSKATTIVLPRFEPQLFLDTIDKYKITTLHLVPPIIIALAKHPLVDKYSLASVKGERNHNCLTTRRNERC